MQDNQYCAIFQDNQQILVTIQGNQIFQSKKHQKNDQKQKLIADLSQSISLAIVKIQILPYHKFIFHLQISFKNKKPISLVVNNNKSLECYIKLISKFCTVKGIQQIMSSCQLVGQGSFAEVYKVITNTDLKMALKTFKKEDFKIKINKQAFKNQIKIMRQLCNKHIVSADGIFETQKNIFLKMQYFSLSLKRFLKKKLTLKNQKKIMKHLLIALQHMKSKDIVHRDLKPDNIMIRGKNRQQFQCVIIDFGLATFANQQQYLFKRCGTPGYLAPQIAIMSNRNKKVTPACDMFSLGCIFYLLLSKKHLFQGTRNNQVLEKNKKLEMKQSKFDTFSSTQIDLLFKMLQKDPKRRITPQEALSHIYFHKQIDDQDQISEQICDLSKKMREIKLVTNQTRKVSIQLLMEMPQNQNFSTLEIDKQLGSERSKRQRHSILRDSGISFEGPTRLKQFRQTNNLHQSSLKKSSRTKRVSRFLRSAQISVL